MQCFGNVNSSKGDVERILIWRGRKKILFFCKMKYRLIGKSLFENCFDRNYAILRLIMELFMVDDLCHALHKM